ncbi:uroporphyrinogen decarboxylase [Rhizopogon vinicolor AM-OR11-026]|uniref:Uroporphyrinogen decarboxylase n=1 Tax=Rhizopogon vinicolor AM-OR11-026 TaxID=1314800 RepID=A0A1B7MRQ0_9AGAM|nr:uroporphyrinogen decarboxylase [Rhizopogon vinicolor AM-OR11-026]
MAQDFPPLKNDLLLRAACGEQTERAPVWVMRQAGRYLPEFRKTRESHEFFEICRTPDLATEITMQPIRRYAGLLDAAIIFCDILVVPQAMGMNVIMNPGPHFTDPLNTPEDVEKLPREVDVDKELGYVFEALTLTRKTLAGQVPLIGFTGAPWTLMMYMIEGGGSQTRQKSKTWLFKYPEASKQLLERITDVCVRYLIGQVNAGAQLLQVFDSNAGDLSPHDFATFALPYLKRISDEVREGLKARQLPVVPLTLFAKGAPAFLSAKAGYDTVGLDWTLDPRDVVKFTDDIADGRTMALQGNLDPVVLYGGREAIEREVKRMCNAFHVARGGACKGWIANLGHGITPGVDPEDMRFFLECVHKYSAVPSA